jgi:hypothetical protein
MKMTNRKKLGVLLVGLFTVALGVFDTGDLGILPARDAHAVVGRPLTPVSYAGVARRSSRRVSRRTYRRNEYW